MEVFNPDDIRGTTDWVNLHTLKPDTFKMKKTEEFLIADGVRVALNRCPITGIQYNCCLRAMQQFYKHFCVELVAHTASQCPITRGVVCFDPQVLKQEPDLTGKPDFDLLVSTTVRFN